MMTLKKVELKYSNDMCSTVNADDTYMHIPEGMIVSYKKTLNNHIELTGQELMFMTRYIAGWSIKKIKNELCLSSSEAEMILYDIRTKLFKFMGIATCDSEKTDP